jgi:DOPA 4,5-dioxygenase
MKLIITLGLFAILVIFGQAKKIDREVIQGFHFHAYYFQNNNRQLTAIKHFHDAVNHEVKNGTLGNCALGQVHRGPVGPHATGMFLTCCNVTSVGPAVSFFMKNHDEFPVLMHALTTSEKLDHSERAFWLGKSLPVDLDHIAEKLHETPTCPAEYDTWNHNDFFPEH